MIRFLSIRYGWVLLVLVLGVRAFASGLVVTRSGFRSALSLDGGEAFHTTGDEVAGARLVGVPGSAVLLALWEERPGTGEVGSYYALSFDGQRFSRARRTAYEISLRYAHFDPLKSVPAVPPSLQAEGPFTTASIPMTPRDA